MNDLVVDYQTDKKDLDQLCIDIGKMDGLNSHLNQNRRQIVSWRPPRL